MIILAYILIALLFIGPAVLAAVGFPVEGEDMKKVYLYPSCYILAIYFAAKFIQSNFFHNKMNVYTFRMMVFIVVSYVALRLVTGHVSKMVLLNSIALPALYACFFSNIQGERARIRVRNFLIIVYCINCFVAIYERLSLQLLYPISEIYSYMDMTIKNKYYADIFRSNALLGHPLSNALITSVVLGFLIVSNLKMIQKYSLIVLGLFSMLCFNARGALLFSALFLVIYFIFHQEGASGYQRRKRWFFGILFLVVCGSLAFYFISNGYGGRFFQHDVSEDSSIAARLEVWQIVQRYNLSYFLLGGLDTEQIALRILGYNHIENWFILGMMIVGLIVMVIAILLFIPMFRLALRSYSIVKCIIVLGICFCVSSSNNSLACGVPAIATFFTCAYAFAASEKRE